MPRSDIANGLYPKPADLKQPVRIYTPGELFWIVKNGIKMSGMPSWSDHSDDELWGTIAFIEKLPGMSEADYGKLVMTSVMRGGGRHNHGGGEAAPDNMSGPDHSAMPGMPAITAPAAPDRDRQVSTGVPVLSSPCGRPTSRWVGSVGNRPKLPNIIVAGSSNSSGHPGRPRRGRGALRQSIG